MHGNKPKVIQHEKVSKAEPKDSQDEKSEPDCSTNQNRIDTKVRNMYEELVSTADADEYLDDFLVTSIVNTKTEPTNNSDLPPIDPQVLLGELRRSIRGKDKDKPNPKAYKEKNASKELKTSQIQVPVHKIDPRMAQEELPCRPQLRFQHEILVRRDHPDRHSDKYETKAIQSGQMQAKPETFYLLPKIINASFAGIVGVSLVFPLDFVKTRLQTQVPGPDGQMRYKGILDCFRKTINTEGFTGMYRGSAVNIILVTPEKAIKLAANDYFRYHLTKPSGELSLARQMLAGGLAGLFQIIITTPMELLKIRMQTSGRLIAEAKAAGKAVPHITPFTIVASLMKENGIFGLYKGISATMLRDVVFSFIYFPLFAALNDLGPKRQDGSGDSLFYWSFISGGISGCFSALTVTPADVVKTRLQNQSKVPGVTPEYLGISDCFAKIFKSEGLKAFFKGGACRVMVISPLFAITQAVYYIGFAENVFGLKNR